MSMRNILLSSLFLLISLASISGARSVRIRENQDFDWQFYLCSDGEGINPGYMPQEDMWKEVQLPHDWSIGLEFERSAGGSSGYLPGGIGIYRKNITIPASARGKRVSIIFDGVYHKSTVLVNGHEVGYHRYGYTGFEYDITPFIKYNADNVLYVHVDHSEESRWYTGSGIYRHVWIQYTEPVHVAEWGTYITTPVVEENQATVKVQTSIVNQSGKECQTVVSQTLVDRNGRPLLRGIQAKDKLSVAAGDTSLIEQSFTVDNPQLWDIDNPYCYRLLTTVSVGGRVTDTFTTEFGIRTYGFDADHGFTLNDRNLKIKGVCLHQDAGSFGVAVPDRSYERRLQILKEFGCNAIRCSHNPPSPEFLEICDTLGFLVIDEAFDKWNSGYYAQFYETSWRQDMSDMILRDRNHPSIILWSIGNEVQEAFDDRIGPQRAAMMQDFVHSLEPSRPVIMAGQQGFTDRFGSVTDIMGYNYLENRLVADHKRFPERKMIVTEAFPFYSGMRENDVRDYVDYAPWNYVLDNDFLAGSFLWAGVDYIGEASAWPSKGWNSCPFDMCMFEKPCAAYLRSVWNDEPFMKLMVRDNGYDIAAGKDHWQYPPMADNWMLPYVDERLVEVRTVTNCDSVRLWGPHWDGSQKDFGFRHTADYDNNTIIWNQPYRKDRMIIAAAYKDGKEVCRDTLRAHGKASVVKLVPDRKIIKADGQDLCHISLSLYDENGIEAQADNREVRVTVEGEGAFRCLDSGEMRREGRFGLNELDTYFGKALIVVQSARTPGSIRVRVDVEGFDKPFYEEIKTE